MEKLCWTLHYHVLYVPTYVFMSRKIYILKKKKKTRFQQLNSFELKYGYLHPVGIVRLLDMVLNKNGKNVKL